MTTNNKFIINSLLITILISLFNIGGFLESGKNNIFCYFCLPIFSGYIPFVFLYSIYQVNNILPVNTHALATKTANNIMILIAIVTLFFWMNNSPWIISELFFCFLILILRKKLVELGCKKIIERKPYNYRLNNHTNITRNLGQTILTIFNYNDDYQNDHFQDEYCSENLDDSDYLTIENNNYSTIEDNNHLTIENNVINPSSGLIMLGGIGGVDTQGNSYGENNNYYE